MVYGIDLGTAYSAITYVNPRTGDIQELIRLESDDFTMPSAVLFLPGNRVKVGQAAIDQSVWEKQGQLIQFFKKDLGQSGGSWPFIFEGAEYYPEDISAIVLRKIAREVGRDHRLPPVERVVVTHPQYFWSNQKGLTRQACELARLVPVATLTEPHAAAIAYGVYETARLDEGDLHVLVFDLGGGTLDVTIMHVSSNVMEVVASDGNARLGGTLWDELLLERVKLCFEDIMQISFSTSCPPEQYHEIRQQVEKAKRRLSEQDEVKLRVTIGEAGEYSLPLVITRAEFEAMARPLVDRCLECCESAVRKAGYGWDKIDKILLVGSSTKMPMIKNALKSRFGRPVERLRDPKGVVAQGAALWGYWLEKNQVDDRIVQAQEEQQEPRPGLALGDTVKGRTPHGIGVLVWESDRDRKIDILVPANTPTPFEVERTYVRAEDNATVLEVPLYESDSDRPEEGVEIGNIVIDRLPPRPRGEPVKVFLKIDIAGCLKVEILDESTGRREERQIDLSATLQRGHRRSTFEDRQAQLDRLIFED